MTEEQYIQKGFNAGYQLQKQSPQLAQTLQQGFADKEHHYAKGFIAGSQEYTKELSQDKSSSKDSYFNKIKQQSQNRSKGKSSDKGIDL